ncbi:MAG: lysine--tRNA ligase [Candidatus Woesearchaeota archaeon]|nr:MAG: lysine--tRNA ligase [Candidatus Woesearchaeota archaeon]
MATEAEERLKKLEWFKKQKIDPYPYSFNVKNKIEDLRKSFSKYKNKKTIIAGRLTAIRGHGKAVFADIEDSTGKIQLLVRIDVTGKKQFEIFQHLDRGDIVGVEGTLMKSKRGEMTIQVKKITLLCKCVAPLPDSWTGVKDKEIRYRKRYLDLIINPDVKKIFITRTKIINAIREFLDKRGYLEVQTPILQSIYGGAAATPFRTHLNHLNMNIYLRTADELYLKRLIVGGFEKVYEFGKDFRNESIDSTHNPEFTQLEIYTAYIDYKGVAKLFQDIMKYVCKKVVGTTEITYQGKKLDFGKWEQISMVDAIKKYAKINVKGKSLVELKKIANDNNIEIPKSPTVGKLISTIHEELAESKIVKPTLVMDYPIETTPLCKPLRKGDKNFVERFEPIAAGMELGNAYSELNDAKLQEKLLRDQVKERKNTDEPWTSDLDKDFISSLEYGMPPTGGIGIGIDRIVMLLTDRPYIREVIFFPFMKPE